MKALILVGGYGTRLRPLTFSKPKPLVEFANRPMIFHQIEALAKVGVTHVVLAVNYQPQVMLSAMKEVEEEFKIKISFSIEEEPLGTAGPLALAAPILGDGPPDEPFLVLNSDVICSFPFRQLIDVHRAHGCEGTLLTTPVTDPSKYGVVVLRDPADAGGCTTQIDRFVEKPKQFVGNQINAGIYIFSQDILKRIPLKPMSIETEVFPNMAKAGELHAIPLQGFWADVGQPKDFITGTALYLSALASLHPESLLLASPPQQPRQTPVNVSPGAPDYEVVGHVLMHPSAKVGPGSKIGPNVVIGPRCVIGSGVRLENCVLMEGAAVKQNACVKHSIIGWYASVGKWARLTGTTVLGEDVHVVDEVLLNATIVLPHKSVSADVHDGQIIM